MPYKYIYICILFIKNLMKSFPFWSDRSNGWPPSERALSRHGLRGERLAAGWAYLPLPSPTQPERHWHAPARLLTF